MIMSLGARHNYRDELTDANSIVYEDILVDLSVFGAQVFGSLVWGVLRQDRFTHYPNRHINILVTQYDVEPLIETLRKSRPFIECVSFERKRKDNHWKAVYRYKGDDVHVSMSFHTSRDR